MNETAEPACDRAALAEAGRLKALRDLELLDTRPEPAFDRVVELAQNLFEAPIALISLIDAGRQWFKSKTGLTVSETPRDLAFCNRAIMEGGVYVVSDASQHPLFQDNPLVTAEPHIRFYAGAPLTVRNGHRIGTLCVIDRKPRSFSSDDGNRLRMLAGLVVIEAENRILKRKMVRRSASMQLAKRSAEAANRAKSEFLSNITHELRTPMHAILNYANAGLKKLSVDQTRDLERYLTHIDLSGKRLLGLLNDLLDLDKLEAGKVEFHFERFDFSDIVQAASLELAPLMNAKALNINISVEGADCLALIDRRRMIQVVINILSNAIKYSPVGGEIEISISDVMRASKKALLLCSVGDQGPGIEEAELEAIFDKFVQSGKPSTHVGGTGLGLSICREIVEAHGGKIWAENGCSSGALIHLALPKH